MRKKHHVRGFFVTGTDTGVGKTLIACALAAWYRRCGFDVGVMKPVATGGRLRWEGSVRRWVSDDALRLSKAAGSRDPWSLINPICFQEPLAPWTAALRARRPIRLEMIRGAVGELRLRHELLIIEGVGGLLVPLTSRATVAELAKWLRMPVLVVARPGLGTLNHTLLTLRHLEDLRLPARGVLINYASQPSPHPMDRVAEQTNPGILKRLTRVPIFGPLPYRGNESQSRADSTLGTWIARHLGARTLHALVRD